MRTLDHPNIIKLVDFSESRQYYYIILDLAPGGELFHQIVRLTYFSENLSRHVITQVAEALEYLHEEKGVVHRYTTQLSLRGITDVIVGISNQRICCSLLYPSFQQRIQSQNQPMMKIKLMKGNLSRVLGLAALA